MSFDSHNSIQGATSGASTGSMFGPYGLVIGAVAGGVDAGFGGPVSQAMGMTGGVHLGKVRPAPMSKTFNDFYGQEGELDHLSSFAQELNALLQGEISGTTPNYFESLKQQDRNLSSMSRGLIPADVLQRANQDSGLQALQGGFGGGSPIGQANAARQLGLTSLDLQSRALQGLPAIEAMSKEANPLSATNFIFTPQAIQQRRDQIKAINAGVTNQQQMVNYGIDQQNMQTAITLASTVAGYGKQAGWFGGSGAPAVGAPGAYEGQYGGQPVYRAIPFDAGQLGGSNSGFYGG